MESGPAATADVGAAPEHIGGGIFFFSSRRRHTSSLCDWSSDVCSSDLLNRKYDLHEQRERDTNGLGPAVGIAFTLLEKVVLAIELAFAFVDPAFFALYFFARSEERRVGRERGSGVGAGDGSAYKR